MIDRGGDEPATNVRNLIPEIRTRTEIKALPEAGGLQVETKSSFYVIDVRAARVIRAPGATRRDGVGLSGEGAVPVAAVAARLSKEDDDRTQPLTQPAPHRTLGTGGQV